MISSAPSLRRFPFTTSGTVLLHIDFLLTGIVMTFLGPMLPILSARWSLSDSGAGALIFTQFLSSMFGMLLSGVLVERQGYRLTLIIGAALMVAGMALLATGPYSVGLLSICILGFGHGITTPAGNLRTAEIDPARSASALNVINAVWGIGAMSSPFLIAFALRFKPATTIAKAGLILALLGGLTLVSAHTIGLIIVGAILAGLGLASIFPISVSLLPAWFGDSARRASGAVFSSGNMGGAALPWVVGAISAHFGSLRMGFIVPLVGVTAMLFFYVTSNVAGQLCPAATPNQT